MRATAQLIAETHARYVDLTLPWKQIEGTCDVGPPGCAPANYAWGKFDGRFRDFTDNGVQIRTLRIANAPDWAVEGQSCPTSLNGRKVNMCPPSPDHYQDLRDFARDAARRYGPASSFNVRRFALWNEPNLITNWGGSLYIYRNAHQYSDMLQYFRDGIDAPRGDPAVKVDAGEVAAGSASSLDGGSDLARAWARYFAAYTDRQERDSDYDDLTIHAYSEDPAQIPAKIFNYAQLPGVDGRVSVTEFGWAAGTPSPANTDQQWKCATAQEQAAKFTAAVQDVRAMDSAEATVHRLVWFSAVDNEPDLLRHTPKCLDDTGRYDSVDPSCQTQPFPPGEVRCVTNTFGLFMLAPDGSLDSPAEACARPVEAAFVAAVAPGTPPAAPC